MVVSPLGAPASTLLGGWRVDNLELTNARHNRVAQTRAAGAGPTVRRERHMFRASRVFVAVALLFIIPTSGLAASNDANEDVPLDVALLAADLGISMSAAEDRLVQQDEAGRLEAALAKEMPSRFAGLWIEESSDFQVTVAVVRGAETGARSIANASSLRGAVGVVGVEHSLSDLVAALTTLRSATERVPFDLDVDLAENRVVVYTKSEAELDTYLRANRLTLPAVATVKVVEELSQPAADIYGGLALSCGTSGFSVRSTVSGERGITAAGHCGNSQSYQGAPLAWRATRLFGNHDEAWFSAPGLFNVRSGWINDGIGGRNIIAVRHRDNQAIGAFVCKYGKTTLFDCGNITSKTFTPNWVPNAAPTFITAKKQGVDMASGGDSGGPIFSSNAALGIVSGSFGSNNIDQVVYVAINYVEAGLSVRVTFPGQ